MGILGLLFRGAREAIQEQSAKKDLERKLGRKVSKDELYSLGSHLDAAQPTAPPIASTSMPRESTVPFGEAKPPMKTRTKLLIAGVLVLVLGSVGVAAVAGVAVLMMPRSTYNKLNPFIPKPAPGDFPANVGRFSRSTEPEYISSSFGELPEYYYSYYKAADAPSLSLNVSQFKTPEEAKSAFDAKIKSVKSQKGYQIVDDSAARFAAVWQATGSTLVLWTEGSKVKYAYGAPQKPLYEFEGALKNAAPVEVVDVKFSPPNNSPTNNTSGQSITVLQLLDDYKKDPAAADKKYKSKTITVTGTVEVADKDKNGKPMIGFMRPGSTAPKDGMVVCSFDKSQEASVSTIKKGDTVRLQGRVFGSILFSVMLDNCSKL